MAKKAKSSSAADSAVKELKATVKRLRAGLEKAEATAAKWRAEARRHQVASATALKKLEKSHKALKKAESKAESKAQSKAQSKPTGQPGDPAAEKVAPKQPVAAPDPPGESWTVTRLRAEARAKGVVGYSRKSKEELIAALKG